MASAVPLYQNPLSDVIDGVKIGKNVAISGKTEITDYPDGKLPSGGYIIKAGEI